MSNKKAKVFIADDESLIRLDLKEILEENDYEVIGEGSNGLEVLEFCKNITPDLMILDIKMPEMDGLTTLEKINQDSDFPKIPVMMLTAFNQPDLIEKAINLGVFAYIVKPIQETDLLPAIEIALARSKEFKQIQKEVGKLKETIEVRKYVERAKGLLMEKLKITEPQAFREIQKLSMDTRMPMKAIAEEVISKYSK